MKWEINRVECTKSIPAFAPQGDALKARALGPRNRH